MKVYFTASSIQKGEYNSIYKKIVEYLKKDKHDVYEKILSQHLPSITQVSSNSIKEWYKEWSEYVSQCDVAIVEGSYPSSIEIGFEISNILTRGKPVILLYKSNKNPVFVNDLYSSRLIKSEYTEGNLNQVLDWCLEEVKFLSNKRFTFYITPDIDEFLESVSADKETTKSEFIRELILKQMSKDSK